MKMMGSDVYFEVSTFSHENDVFFHLHSREYSLQMYTFMFKSSSKSALNTSLSTNNWKFPRKNKMFSISFTQILVCT